jgi:transposase-like protein
MNPGALLPINGAHNQEPRVITVDKNAAYPKAINEFKAKEELH